MSHAEYLASQARIILHLCKRDGDCLIWRGRVSTSGYGTMSLRGDRPEYVHRVIWMAHHGPIAEGNQIDHLCQSPLCCNIAHLESVTQAENRRRQALMVTHCKRGHPFDASNTVVTTQNKRQCRICNRIRARKTLERKYRAGLVDRRLPDGTRRWVQRLEHSG